MGASTGYHTEHQQQPRGGKQIGRLYVLYWKLTSMLLEMLINVDESIIIIVEEYDLHELI